MSYIPNDSSVAKQSVITINCDVSRSIVEERRDNVLQTPDTWDVIGRDQVDAPHLQIRQDELVIARITDMSGVREKRAQQLEVFSSLNGISIPPGMTQEAFEDQFICVGFASDSNFPEGDPPGTTDSIAVTRAGSGTTINNSAEVFFPGDVFGYRLPSVNKKIRARDATVAAENKRRSERIDVGKHTPILTKITYSQINNKMESAVSALLDNPRVSVPNYMLNLAIGSSVVLPEDVEMAINLKRMFNLAFYSAIVHAVDGGVVEFTQSFKNQGLSEYEQLAGVLGLIKSSTVQEDISLFLPYFRHIFMSSLGGADQSHTTAATQQLNFEFGPAPKKSLAAPFIFQRRTNPRDHMEDIAASASNGLARVYGQALNRVMRRKVGTVSNFSMPGDNLDYACY